MAIITGASTITATPGQEEVESALDDAVLQVGPGGRRGEIEQQHRSLA
jgi:hypothetical protein